MPDQPQSTGRFPPPHRRALLRYVAVWLVGGVIVAIGGLQLLRHEGRDEVSLPPIRDADLIDASRTAGCELRHERRGQLLRPAVAGPPAPAVRPGVYTATPPQSSLIGAIRRGIVVIYYRRSLQRDHVEQIERLQESIPEAILVTPNEKMKYEVAATAWRKLLGCRSFRDRTLDAIRFFSGRYIGSGPDQ